MITLNTILMLSIKSIKTIFVTILLIYSCFCLSNSPSERITALTQLLSTVMKGYEILALNDQAPAITKIHENGCLNAKDAKVLEPSFKLLSDMKQDVAIIFTIMHLPNKSEEAPPKSKVEMNLLKTIIDESGSIFKITENHKHDDDNGNDQKLFDRIENDQKLLDCIFDNSWLRREMSCSSGIGSVSIGSGMTGGSWFGFAKKDRKEMSHFDKELSSVSNEEVGYKKIVKKYQTLEANMYREMVCNKGILETSLSNIMKMTASIKKVLEDKNEDDLTELSNTVNENLPKWSFPKTDTSI